MRHAGTLARFALVVAASVAPPIGCKALGGGSAAPTPTQRGIDEPPPLHTGGLDVLGSGPSGQQGPGASAGSHGDPVAEGIATGIGVAAMGGTAVKTVGACAQPDASPTCLRGPGPADTEHDGGR